MSLDKIPRTTIKFEGPAQPSAFRPRAAMDSLRSRFSLVSQFPNEKADWEPPGPGWGLHKNPAVVDGRKP